MKLSDQNSSKKLITQRTKSLFLFLFAAFATASAVQAQSINDDLQPSKPTAVKPQSTPTRPRNNNQTKPKQTTKKTSPRTAGNTQQSPPPDVSTPSSAAPPAVMPDTPPAAAAAAPLVAPVQTSSEIFERFTNFQKSASVTVKDWTSVVRQTTAVLQSNPDDKTAKAQLAVAQAELAFDRGDYSNALIQFNAAAQFLPASSLPFYGIGRIYLNTKQPNEAEEAFARAVKLNKSFALGYKGLGDAATAQGKTKKAQDYYKQAARIGIAGSASAAGNSPANGSGSNSGSQSGATGSGGDSTLAAPQESAYDRELKIARDYTATKKWQMALDKLQPLAATNPSADLYIAIGDNYYGMQAWLSAQQAYRKATEINPNLAVAFYRTGMVLFEMNEFQAASDAFEKSLILDQSGATINRAQARKMADRANEKVRDMNKSGKKKGFLGIG